MMHLQKPPLGIGLDWSNPLNDGLVMHLAMNEGHGDFVRDLSMNGNHGTLENMAFPSTPVSGWNPGQTGVGLNFDGTSDYVDCGNDASLDINDKYTVSVWVNINSWTNFDRVWAKSHSLSAITNRITLALWNNGTLAIDMRIGDSWEALLSTDVIVLREWNNIVFTLDNTNQQAKIYQNGVLKGSDINFTLPNTLAANFILGAETTAINYADIVLDQVRIYNRALSAKEVQDYYINPWQVYLDDD